MDNVNDTRETNTGCLGCFGWALLVILVVSIGAGVWTWIDERNAVTIPITGVVEIDERFCVQSLVFINGDSTPLRGGTRNEQGLCEHTFSTDVEDRETFTFQISGHDSVTVRRSLIDTIGPNGDTVLEVRLSW